MPVTPLTRPATKKVAKNAASCGIEKSSIPKVSDSRLFDNVDARKSGFGCAEG
jgi:hypothetical protein